MKMKIENRKMLSPLPSFLTSGSNGLASTKECERCTEVFGVGKLL